VSHIDDRLEEDGLSAFRPLIKGGNSAPASTSFAATANPELLAHTSQILTALRGIRSQEKVGFKVPLVLVEINLSPALQRSFELVEADLLAALNAQKITVTAANESANPATGESELTASSYQSTANQSDTEIKVLHYQLG
jgi:hypothetical protein